MTVAGHWTGPPLASLTYATRAALQEHLDLEQAHARLLALTPPTALPVVVAEVERRREHMTERAAYESVADDLQTGRWMP